MKHRYGPIDLINDDDETAQRFFKNDYEDRGMLKWQGFFLSDHTSTIKKDKKASVAEPMKPQQTNQEMMDTLFRALEYKYQVHIQLQELQHGETVVSIEGLVMQLDDGRVLVRVDDKGNYQWNIAKIRNVEMIPNGKIKW
ncbi:MAG: hypothetical protein DUD32_11110 [Lactobacillus sp.]|nr:MAG: hypothetical protein DUD32_11110 [Lactobacillus sp.]